MKRKIPYQSYLIVLLFFVIGCSVLNNKQNKLFTIKDAYYQSWMVSEQEKGTTLTIVLTNIEKDISFDSIIFRGIQMPVNMEVKESTTILRSTISQNQARFIENTNTAANKPDQLIYTYKNERKSFKLESIRREEMKYK